MLWWPCSLASIQTVHHWCNHRTNCLTRKKHYSSMSASSSQVRSSHSASGAAGAIIARGLPRSGATSTASVGISSSVTAVPDWEFSSKPQHGAVESSGRMWLASSAAVMVGVASPSVDSSRQQWLCQRWLRDCLRQQLELPAQATKHDPCPCHVFFLFFSPPVVSNARWVSDRSTAFTDMQ